METFKQLINIKLDEYISTHSSDETEVELLKHIFQGGKRLRPMICLAIGQHFNRHGNEILEIAIAIEMIHNASLIIDDLPCMDNDEYRRGILTVHAKYGQDVAVQIALKLVMNALNKIYSSIGNLPNKMKKIFEANRIVYQNIGLQETCCRKRVAPEFSLFNFSHFSLYLLYGMLDASADSHYARCP